MSDSIHARALAIEGMIRAGNHERALGAIHHTVETIVTEPLCTSQVYASQVLDRLAQQIGTALLPPNEADPGLTKDALPTYVYLATKLQRSGGHSRLLRDFILARPHARHIVLLTGMAGPSATKWLAQSLASITHFECWEAPRGGYVATVRWLQSQLRQHAPEHTYLFNHHEDVGIVAAAVPALNLAMSFCHHGDHHLTLGMYLPHVTHLDFHPTAFHRCRDSLGIENRYIPFTVASEPTRDATGFMPQGTVTTCTAAGSNKVEAPYPLQYTQIVPQIIAATGGTHIHIGRLTRKGLKTISNGMRALAIPSERFVYIPWVDSVRKALLEKKVDLYISSFPLGGGLTLVEVMSAGIPATLHKHMLVRELGGLDMVYEEAFLWRTVEELTQYLRGLTPHMLAAQSAAARAHYTRYYGHPLDALLANPQHNAPPLTAEFSPQQDEWALWATKQVTIRHMLYRFAYRCYRRLRRRMHGYH